MNAASDAIPENSDSMFNAELSSFISVQEAYAFSASLHARLGNIMNLTTDSTLFLRIYPFFYLREYTIKTVIMHLFCLHYRAKNPNFASEKYSDI